MNYIEFEIGGKLRGFNFGLKFLGDVLKHFDVDIVELGGLMDSNPFMTRPTFLYYAHLAYVQSKQQPVTFNEDDVIGWVEEMENGISNDNVIQSVRLVLESVKRHLPKSEEATPEDSKKK